MTSSPTHDIPPGKVFVTDFDGTMTRFDFYDRALQFLDSPEAWAIWQAYLRGETTLFQALQGIFALLRISESDILEIARRTELDPQAAEAVASLRAAGWQLVVASAGCQWYIQRLLSAQGIDVPLVANPGRFEPGRGLFMEPPYRSPYYISETGIDKAAVVAEMRNKHSVVVYAGDSTPDVRAAMLVEPSLRFARNWLADHFESQGVPFRRFQRWSEIATQLVTLERSP